MVGEAKSCSDAHYFPRPAVPTALAEEKQLIIIARFGILSSE
jgi:hypothetical protein